MRTLPTVVSTLLLTCLLAGCKPKTVVVAPVEKDYLRQLPPGQLALRKITDPRDIPDFTVACDNTSEVGPAIANSLEYLAKPSSKRFFPYGAISHDQAVASLKAFQGLLESRLSPGEMNAAIRERFDVYVSVGCDDQGTVLYTGYYTPIFEASPVKTARFAYPLYRPPANLAKGPNGEILGLEQPDKTLKPVPDRKTIEAANPFAGNELAWLSDPFEVYIAHVQGSVRLRMPDGKVVTVGYAASNGHEYKSVGRILVEEKKLTGKELSLQGMIRYFKAHPAEVSRYTWQNPRFIFFAVTDDAPRGSLNEPVTPLRSIATDKSIFPRACLAFVTTQVPRPVGGQTETRPFQSFALDQDTGSAIRAAGRCDLYMGIGPDAGELAGRTTEEGKLYYLFLKPGYQSSGGAPTGTTAAGGGATGGASGPPPVAPQPMR